MEAITCGLWVPKRRFREYWRALSQSMRSGRPQIARQLRKLIRRMWQANPTWGSPRIVAELRKLGIDVAKSTVEKYLEQNVDHVVVWLDPNTEAGIEMLARVLERVG